MSSPSFQARMPSEAHSVVQAEIVKPAITNELEAPAG